MTNPPEPRIFLVGLRGAGKSTLARLLGERLGWPWLDADAELTQRRGRTVVELFAELGEPEFRRLEAELLEELTLASPQVLATGGGAILAEANRRRLRERGLVVWLRADPATLARRLAADPATAAQRPPLTGRSREDELRLLLEERERLYAETADLTLETAGTTPAELCRQLQEQVRCLISCTI